MCRLLAVVSSEASDFRFSLREAPRSMAELSKEHPHGWGIAVHLRGSPVVVHKRPMAAGACAYFDEVAPRVSGEVLVAHVRQRTVGPVGIENTHPFQRGRWTFAHNGTIKDIDWVTSRASAARRAQLEGDTDSERFFALLLTELDALGASDSADGIDRARLDAAIAKLTAECRARPDFGAVNFILTDGEVVYAHRFGRTLHLLERVKPADQDQGVRRRNAILIASEQMTQEPWTAIEDGTLLRIDRDEALPRWQTVTA